MNLSTIKTPSLVLDAGRVRQNAARISDIATRNGVRLRPHIKTHKCIEVARIQTDGHDGAITVSTLAEAKAFSENGFRDITYAVPIEPGKFAEAVEILQSGVKLNLLTDDAETAKLLDEAAGRAGVRFDVFVKIDCGTHRVGVETHTPEAVDIPRHLFEAKNLHFAGILTHAGHSYDVKTVDEIKAVARHERDIMAAHAAKLRGHGIEVPTVSIGSTPTINHHIDHLEGIDEVRPGNYIFLDNYQATLGSSAFDDCALTVLAAVVHRDASRRKIVIDAGGIAMSKDRGPVGLDPACGYGRVLDVEGKDTGMRLNSLSQEHGVIEAADDTFDRFKVGERVRILANHSCMTAAQHTYYNILENGEIVDKWKIHTGW